MLKLLKNLLSGKSSSGFGAQSLDKDDLDSREGRLKAILRSELNQNMVDGRKVTHRRLETLMLATGATRKETVRLLRKIGARPSGRHGSTIWTMKPKK